MDQTTKYFFISFSGIGSTGQLFGDIAITCSNGYPSKKTVMSVIKQDNPYINTVIINHIDEWSKERFEAWIS